MVIDCFDVVNMSILNGCFLSTKVPLITTQFLKIISYKFNLIKDKVAWWVCVQHPSLITSLFVYHKGVFVCVCVWVRACMFVCVTLYCTKKNNNNLIQWFINYSLLSKAQTNEKQNKCIHKRKWLINVLCIFSKQCRQQFQLGIDFKNVLL